MDFPKSVPGVGLVGGQFADEDASIGRQGSLIPAVWGNAVTLEILGVIEAAGLEPSEAETGQLLEAVRALVPERSAFTRVSGTVTLPASVFGIYALADGGAAAAVTLPSTADLFDDTELLLFANHANTAAMQVKAAAGQTVQGPAALMGASTAAFMLPAGGDWVRLRSEKAQGRWVVVSSYANARMDMVDARVATLEGRMKALGDGQTRQTVTRSPNVVYKNETLRTMEVYFSAGTTQANGYVSVVLSSDAGVTWIQQGLAVAPLTATGITTHITLLPGEWYQYGGSGTGTVTVKEIKSA